MDYLRPDGTNVGVENQTTGADGWTTTFYDQATGAPSGTWNIQANVSNNGNTGSDLDTISFISPYTGNLGKQCYILPRIGNPVPSNMWSLNDNVTIRCEYRTVSNFIDAREDTDSNDTRLDIEIANLNGTQQTLLDGASMTWFTTGKYDYNMTLNSTNGFINSRCYMILGNAKIDSKDVIADSSFCIKDSEVSPNITRAEISHTNEVSAGDAYSAEIRVYYLNGSLVDPNNVTIVLEDPVGATTNFNVNMTGDKIATGRYNFSYSTSGSNTQGWYRIRPNVTLGSLSTIADERWHLVGGPFDVRDIVISDNVISTLGISVTLENTGSTSQDMTVVWNLTRTDNGTLLDSGSDTVLVSASSTRTYTIAPTTTYLGEVKITFLGHYAGTEKAGAFSTFTTEEESSSSGSGNDNKKSPPSSLSEEWGFTSLFGSPKKGSLFTYLILIAVALFAMYQLYLMKYLKELTKVVKEIGNKECNNFKEDNYNKNITKTNHFEETKPEEHIKKEEINSEKKTIFEKIWSLLLWLYPRRKKENSITGLIGKKVYTGKGKKIGIVEDIILGDSKIDGLKVKVTENKHKKENLKGFIVKLKDIVSFGDIILIDKKVLEEFRKHSSQHHKV